MKDIKTVAVIPARMASSRFPGKPLASLLGLPMVEHVYRRTAMSSLVHEVYVATCDVEVRRIVDAFGGQVIMTSPEHQRASDRVAEAAEGLDADIVVMVQGDEPMVAPAMIEEALSPMLKDPDVQCVNLVKCIVSEEEFGDPNTIKVVMDRYGNALYFSREPIPSSRINGVIHNPLFKQVCIIPFRREFLLEYSWLESTPLETAESIDMLRLLEHGYKIRLAETQLEAHAVDIPQDLVLVEGLMRCDPITLQYVNLPAGGPRA